MKPFVRLRDWLRSRRYRRLQRWLERNGQGSGFVCGLLQDNERLRRENSLLSIEKELLLNIVAREGARITYETAFFMRRASEAETGAEGRSGYNPGSHPYLP